MATSKFTTRVRNCGNMNKGGSKIISRYKDGSLVSTKTVRGSPNNKSGGSDNQYSTQVYTLDRPNSSSSRKSSTKSSTRSTNNGSSEGADTLFSMILVLLLLVGSAIGAACYGLYKLVVYGKEKFTHNESFGIIDSTKETNHEPSTQSPTICDGETRRTDS